MDKYAKTLKIFRAGFKKHDTLFSVPNPFDEYRREKTGWYSEIKKIENQAKSVRQLIDQFAVLHTMSRSGMLALKSYCNSLPNKCTGNTNPLELQGR